MNVKNILESLGYKLIRDGKCWRTRPIYRNSDNPTSLRIHKNGNFADFSAGITGNFVELIALSLGYKDVSEAHNWLKTKNFKFLEEFPLPKIEMPIIWKNDILNTFIDDQSYLESRGISAETGRLFKGGVVKKDKMSGRYVFPIFDNHNRIIGLVGRDITGYQKLKYKKLGVTKKFIWPAHVNRQDILDKEEVILVESPMCVLKLYEAGIKNSICLWGVTLSDAVLGFLVGAQPKRIIISLNKDGTGNNFVGEKAAQKVYEKLCYFFNLNQLNIIFPYTNDFAEQNVLELKNWYKEVISDINGN